MAKCVLLWVSILISVLILSDAQTSARTYSPTPEPTDSPTNAPTLGPIICRHHGRKNETCDHRTVPPTSPPILPTAPTAPTQLNNGGHTLLPTPSPINDSLAPTAPTVPPTQHPITHGRNPSLMPNTSLPTLTPPTPMPLDHDLDTDFPSKDPTPAPTVDGYTRPPTSTTKNPTVTPSASPTKSPSHNPTVSPTVKPSVAPTKRDISGEVMTPTVSSGGTGNIDGVEQSPTEDVLLDLTSILLIVFGILICGILCGIMYYWYGRKRAVKRAQALQFRFNANRAMELDRVKSNTMSDKRTTLLNMEHDGPIRVPEDEPGGIDMDAGDTIVILSPQTNDPALDMMLGTKGGDNDNNKYLNVNNSTGVDEFDDSVTDPIVDKLTDHGMEINMNEDEVIDDIDNNDYVTAGGENIDMDETDETDETDEDLK